MKENINKKVKNIKEKFYNESLIIIETLDHISLYKFVDDLSEKLNTFSDKFNSMIDNDNKITTSTHHLSDIFHEQLISRWPLFVYLISAMICLGSSAIFHWFSALCSKTNEILSRLDYAGISILIAGSCYPPYFYFFYCETFTRNIYLTIISIFASAVFFYSFEKDFNKPHRRKLRGLLFLTLGISAGLPIFHLSAFP